ncbi:CAP domain-containing protein [Labrenzia suaedae]|uniref:CAP domain-containing protein n=2 Tax=Roseibium litorale TaxID=2803841 RepID=A0ABR9CLH5_9HYPH|nr:CAP domain-containing protein [Roseibium litorale]MBD8891603.1 CAP domain-containing protein [Roseibium litorale]
MSRTVPVIAGCLITAALLSGCTETKPSRPSFYNSMARPDASIDQQSAASMLSLYRKNNGLGPLTPDPELTAIAKSQAVAMAKAGSVSASLGADQKLTARMASIGEPGTAAVENVSGGYRTLAEAFSGWRESPKHNAVMLDKTGTRFGLATAYSSTAKHKVFWSLIVAAPKP